MKLLKRHREVLLTLAAHAERSDGGVMFANDASDRAAHDLAVDGGLAEYSSPYNAKPWGTGWRLTEAGKREAAALRPPLVERLREAAGETHAHEHFALMLEAANRIEALEAR